MIYLPHILALLQSSESLLDKYGLLIFSSIASSLCTYFLTRREKQSASTKLDAETIASFIKTIKEIQDTNQELFVKFTTIRDEAEKVDETLDKTRRELEDCLKENSDCSQCQEAITHAVEMMRNVETFLKDVDGAEVLLQDIRDLSEKLRKKVRQARD